VRAIHIRWRSETDLAPYFLRVPEEETKTKANKILEENKTDVDDGETK
jgi:hypothetical protein